jgi:hypothetical protein
LAIVALYFHCNCGQHLRSDEDQAGGFTRCLACSRLVRVPSLDRANLAVGIDTPVSSPTRPAKPVPLAPPVIVLESKAVEVSSSTFEPRPRSSDDPEIFPLRDPFDRIDF